jgi:hypothetical protein
MRLQVFTAGVPQQRKLARRPVRQRHRPGHLGDQLLHRLAHPEGGVGPERRPQPRVVAAARQEQPGDTLLDQLASTHRGVSGEAAGDGDDRRHQALDEFAAGIAVAGFGGDGQLSFAFGAESGSHCVPRVGSDRAWKNIERSHFNR